MARRCLLRNVGPCSLTAYLPRFTIGQELSESEQQVAIDVNAEVLINVPREKVSAYATNPENDPVWVSGISQAKLLTEPPVGKGSQVDRVASFMGKRIEYVLEIVDWTPQALMTMRSVKGPFPMEVTYAFQDAPGATLARINVKGGPGGLLKLVGPLMAMGVNKNITKDLKTLKRLMESDAKQTR